MQRKLDVMIGHWIQPWPGESLLGEVIAVSGDAVVCRARNGLRFEVAMSDVKRCRAWHGGSLLSDVAREALTRRDWPVLSN